MSYYQSINGVNYDKGLLAKADEYTTGRGDGRISEEDAATLWKDAFDGGKVTRIERRTLEYILQNYKCTDKGTAFIEGHLYHVKAGSKYDKVLLDAAELALEGRGDGRISENDAEALWAMVASDGLVTTTERNTIRFIIQSYKCTEAAQSYLLGKLM